jgi:hypothetical protein
LAPYTAVLEIGNHLNNTGIVFLAGSDSAYQPYGVYSGAFFASDNSAKTMNAFQHVAWVRSGNSLLFYRNQTLLATRSFTNNLTNISSVSIGVTLSGSPLSNYVYTGQMDELIVTKGVALAPSEFAYAAALPDA